MVGTLVLDKCPRIDSWVFNFKISLAVWVNRQKTGKK